MRLLPLVSTIALISVAGTFSMTPAARADEIKYKSHTQPPADREDGVYKRPPDNRPPVERPPDREHPIKQPPDTPDTPTHEPPPEPPNPGGWTPSYPSCPPRACPAPSQDYDQDYDIEMGAEPMSLVEAPVIVPVPIDVNRVLARRMRAMTVDGFAGEVVVGYHGQVQFQSSWLAGGGYDISLVTRAFTVSAVYRLISSAKLTLATTLGDMFPNAPPDKRGITIEQLLAQTSGLGNSYGADGESDRDMAVSKLLAQPLAHAPGAEFTYSDDGYVILAATIEIASGMDYATFLVRSGIVGGDMHGTTFQPGDWGMRGSGGIVSTANDLFTWTSHFLNAPESGEITWARASTGDGVELGYGWYWTGHDSEPPLMRSSGSLAQGDNVMVVVYPNDAVLVVTSNRFYGNLPWSERVANVLEPVLRSWEPVEGSPTMYWSDASGARR